MMANINNGLEKSILEKKRNAKNKYLENIVVEKKAYINMEDRQRKGERMHLMANANDKLEKNILEKLQKKKYKYLEKHCHKKTYIDTENRQIES